MDWCKKILYTKTQLQKFAMGRECSLGIYVCNCNFLYIGGKKKFFFGIVHNWNKNKNNKGMDIWHIFSILKRKLGSCNNINPIETFSKVHLWSLGAKWGQFGQLLAIFWGQFMDTVASQYFLWVVFFPRDDKLMLLNNYLDRCM